MASTCAHGFAPGTCLICQTLASTPASKSKSSSGTTTLDPPASGGKRASRRAAREAAAIEVAPRGRPDAVFEADRRPARSGHLGLKVLGTLVALALIALAIFALVGVVFTILHILELVAVGVGAAWVGYHVGHFRGSRNPRA